jgi:hypothetical protein
MDMNFIKHYKLFESQLIELKGILSDIEDLENIEVEIKEVERKLTFQEKFVTDYQIYIFVYNGYFKVNQNIRDCIVRLYTVFKNEYSFTCSYKSGYKHQLPFYIYNDERGLRDYDTVRLDGSGKFPAPTIQSMSIFLHKK